MISIVLGLYPCRPVCFQDSETADIWKRICLCSLVDSSGSSRGTVSSVLTVATREWCAIWYKQTTGRQFYLGHTGSPWLLTGQNRGLHFHTILPRCLSLIPKPSWGRAGRAALLLLLVLCWRKLFPQQTSGLLKTFLLPVALARRHIHKGVCQYVFFHVIKTLCCTALNKAAECSFAKSFLLHVGSMG